MSKFVDLTGKKFGKLTVVKRCENAKGGVAVWECACDCGKSTKVRGHNLKSGAVKSCGCLKRRPKTATHKMSKTRIYREWAGIKARCVYRGSRNYKNYGAKGISMCKEWSESFEAFYAWAMRNKYEDNLTIDRIDNSKGYSPSNCRWVTKQDQCNNTSRNLVFEYLGKKQTLTQWCEELGADFKRVHNRIYKLGWDFEKAINSPVQSNKRNKRF